MRLDEFDPSRNTRDLGTSSGGGFNMGGGGGGGGGLFGILFALLPMLFGRKLGCGMILLIGAGLLFFSMFAGGGGQMVSSDASNGTGSPAASGGQACDTEAEMFSCRVLTSTEQVWGQVFQQEGEQYAAPTLNFYSRENQSGCGAAQAAMGPFYCPADQGIYLDTDFFNELRTQFGAGGDAANAYVIAHEVGHHIQNLMGTNDRVREAQSRGSETEANAMQVRMELQADCYAGVWAATARTPSGQPVIEAGDIEEAMTAAHAIGDDTLMRGAGQTPVESMFTHGSSEQRMRWLKRGLDTADYRQCETFDGPV